MYVNGAEAGSFTVDMFTNNDVLIYGIIALFPGIWLRKETNMEQDKKWIRDYLTGEEIVVTNKPEEIVRQNYLRILHEEYGYSKENIV